MRKTEYDFLTWTSFPSSLKIVSDEPRLLGVTGSPNVSVTPGSRVKAAVKSKLQNILYDVSHIALDGGDGTKWFRIPGTVKYVDSGKGTLDWTDVVTEAVVPEGVVVIRVYLVGGGGTPEAPGFTWFDDLRVYQDGVLIYSNDFAKWDPYLGAGVLGVAVPSVAYAVQKPLLEKEPLWAAGLAGLGALIGGGVGLLTALGLVPVPQIPPLPTLEAPQERARLGTYVVRG